MTLNDLLQRQGIDPKNVIVLRHRPEEPELRRVLPWLAADKPQVFNAYQRAHRPRLEQALTHVLHVASFIAQASRDCR